MENALTTEEKIRQAATKVFLEKGFDGTTTRDIAAEAGINLALLNYYFRSKQKLFDSVFEEMIQLFFEGVGTVLSQPMPLKGKAELDSPTVQRIGIMIFLRLVASFGWFNTWR